MRFWDASAIVSLILDEAGSQSTRQCLESDPITIIWWSTQTEVVSALTRSLREERIQEIDTGLGLFREIIGRGSIVPPTDEILVISERLLRTHALRAADAHQLAAAIVASESQPSTLPFVCLDDRLIEAARKEGFHIV